MKLLSLGLRLIVLVLLGRSPALAQGQLWIVDDDGGSGVDFGLNGGPAIKHNWAFSFDAKETS